jgi:uncharacterized protein
MEHVLLDTGVIVAWLNRRDHHHQRCVEALATVRHPLVTCEAVISECCFLMQRIPAAIDEVLKNVADGTFRIPFQLSEDAADVASILRKYSDTPADFADACLVAMADQLDTGDILSLDSHFKHYRWRRNRRFNLLVPLD